MTSVHGRGRSLAEAKDVFNAELDKGTRCPCCERYARRYRRKFNSGMAVSLVALVRLSQQQLIAQAAEWPNVTLGMAPSPWIHGDEIGRYLGRFSKATYPHGEIGKLVHWKLAEPMPGTRAMSGRPSGSWRPTPAGIDFVRRIDSIRLTVVLWNNVVCGFEGPEVKIDNVMGEHFDYAELMGG